ncbi:prostaglandin E2 receptor EP4 subtype-like [Ruditapes philippinarum]|uniref:prostaglandin E2 receptor EP4 subtype-like n=1 Tax=Ruditapes philippinarum TaxID=129788 RepID=UPI00295BF999|nr:prostaglandin E2 receptor EP4 subtype-like [Ruditapes philippinarum]
MAVDRVLAICFAFYYKQHVSVKTWKLACLLATVSVAALNLLPLIGLGSYTGTRKSTGKMYCTSLSFKVPPIERVYGMAYGFAGIICVIMIVCLNAVVIRSVLKLSSRVVSFAPSESATSSTGDTNSSKVNQTSVEVAFAKLMLALATVYLVCETPYNVLILLQQFRVPVDVKITSYVHLISGFSYTVDPVVYILIRKTNRKRIVDFLCRRKDS